MYGLSTRHTARRGDQLFEGKKVRIAWDAEQEKYYFSVTDIVQVLTDSVNPRDYIKKMLRRDPELKSKWGTICPPVVMLAPDGKKRKTQAADLEGIFRIIQSIPSKKAEPVRQWLAELGKQRIDQIIDPELTFQMAIEDYRRQGYSDRWINERMRSIEMRKELTDEWHRSGIHEPKDFAILTNVLTKAWSGMTTGEYKRHKGLTKENLRDNMKARADTLSGRKAFGDAENTDAESDSRRFYALRLGKFNARRCQISGFRRLIK